MDGPGAPAEPAGAVPPPLAFFGLWPRIGDDRPAAGPRLVVTSPAGATSSGRAMDEGRRIA